MKKLISAAIALTFLASTAAVAQRDNQTFQGQNQEPRRNNDGPGNSQRPDSRDNAQRQNGRDNDGPRWSRGERLPDQYRQNRYSVNDWRQRNLTAPPRGYRWVRNDNNQFLLAAIATGIIAEIVIQDQYQNNRRWLRGQRLSPEYYRNGQYAVSDWRGNQLRSPARGYRWYLVNDQYVLAAPSNGYIRDVMPGRR